MNSGNSSSNIDLTCAPGFGFRPTNEELINYYLKRKIAGDHAYVDNFIVTVDNLADLDPSALQQLCAKPWNDTNYWYFFHMWNHYGKGKGYRRRTKTGHWKKTGKELKIVDSDTETVIGKRSILVFYRDGTSPIKTNYIMHVFEMINHSSNQWEAYVVCRLQKNKNKTKKEKFETDAISVQGEPSGEVVSGLENPSTPSVMQRDNDLEYQNKGSLSPSQDVSLPLPDGGELSVEITSDSNIPLATSETQEEFGQARVGHESWNSQLKHSVESHHEMQPLHGLDDDSNVIEDLLLMFYIPEDETTMDNIFNDLYPVQSLDTDDSQEHGGLVESSVH